MAIAGAVVTPARPELEPAVIEKLRGYDEIEVKDSGEKGIAVVLEAKEPGRLKDISEEIQSWEEVLEFSLAYLNWEELEQ
jgi:nitrate reductase NapAB chaperone NapD